MPRAAVLSPESAFVNSHTLYNARVSDIYQCHSHLRILRVVADRGPLAYEPGQYGVLGLGNWEASVYGAAPAGSSPRLIKRAYSFSCPLLDEHERLLRPADCRWLEFYIALVEPLPGQPPGLTPRLFRLVPGDRLYLGERAHGRYTLAHVRDTDTVVFAATGTGEAPHNAMVAELLARGHRGRIVCATTVRYRKDLGYLHAHRRLEAMYKQYCYLALTTREPENLNPAVPGYVGKWHLQDLFASGEFERRTQLKLDPSSTHIFLCGNPAMVGLPHRDGNGNLVFPRPRGMVEVLSERGFVLDRPGHPGNIHVESYW